MIKAYSYARFSSTKQQKGSSIERQVQLAEEYAAKRGFDLDRTITYRDQGVSAFKGKNLQSGALGAFLKAIENGTVPSGSYLLVESIDRISRGDLMTAQNVVKSIVEKDITIVTMFDGREYDRLALNDLGRLMVLLSNMHLAHEESRKKSERSSASWQFARQKIGSRRVKTNMNHWLELSGDNSGYQVRDGCKELINEVFDRYLGGQGCNVIAKWLIAKRDTLYKWSPAVVCRLLKNRALLGEWQAFTLDHSSGKYLPATEIITGYFPQVIDRDKFNKAQCLLASRAKVVKGPVGGNASNLFTGILRCAYCGSTIEMVNPGWSKKGHPVELKYVCRRARMGDCHLANWDVREFEDAFFSSAREVAETAKRMRNGAGANSRLLALKGEQDEILSKLASLEGELRKIRGRVSPILVETIQELEGDKRRILDEIARAYEQLENERQGNVLESISRPNNLEERLWVASVIRQVVKRIDLFFVGDFWMLGPIMRYKSLQIRANKNLSGVVGYRIRKKFSTDALRFFEVRLAGLGQGYRARYPTTVFERTSTGFTLRRDYQGRSSVRALDENDQTTWQNLDEFEGLMATLSTDVSYMLGLADEDALDLVKRFQRGELYYMDLLRKGLSHDKANDVLGRLRSSQVDLFQFSNSEG